MILARCLFLLALLPILARAEPNTVLPHSVVAALKSAGIPQAHVGVVVWEAGQPEPMLSHKAQSSFNPASVMKLLTTYAGLDLLGPAYTWKTDIFAEGPVDEGVLKGNLYFKGYGDPSLTLERFWLLLRELKLRGIREIRGDVILDASFFPADLPDPGRFDGDPRRAYNAPPSALLVNFNAASLRLTAEGDRLIVSLDPLPVPLLLDNQIKSDAGRCNDWRDHLSVDYQAGNGPLRLVLAGSYALACGEKSAAINLGDPLDTTAGLFRALWGEQGGKLAGTVRPGVVPGDASLVMRFESPPLADVLRSINKWSNNVMARQLFLTLGAERSGAPARLEKSVVVVRDWLKSKGIDASGIVLENGAGLSRIERIQPINLATLMQAAWRSPVFAELESSLPIVAVDGTMETRLRDGEVAGHAHIKTGTLANAKNLAGYLFDRHGRRWIVVFFINDLKAEGGTAAQDALLEWVYQGAGSKAVGQQLLNN
ncbi:MAG TPA: D-alanyl-D-alanine carboxypeptidase/D-alanyl-D-alanine-endopeptidase [Thiobacillaceae bacterium]|nr:D-alanyl-D-alanine carboxypeptidase/D-alanyl-D-alanine-endopeptidase [Thiobacillaceae bacterium]